MLSKFLSRIRKIYSTEFKQFSTVGKNVLIPELTVTQGKVRGQLKELKDGTPYYSFKGIPYAEPPVGKLRFKAPVPKTPWQGIYDADNHGPVCPQIDMITGEIIEGDENCLFLNVYTKNVSHKPDNSTPVIVFIHGGAFMSGSGNSDFYGPEYLLQHDIILVTINYRLEVLGFLCLDIEDVPGNAGMRDQVLALEWVKNNIAQFGGNPNNITVMGESAGGASASYHLVSPLAKGLFNKVITQSGVFLCDWAYSAGARDRAFRLGKHLGKETNDPRELLYFLQSLPSRDLVKVTHPSMLPEEKKRGLPIHFGPVVEKKFANVKSYLDKPPIQSMLMKEITNVPLLIGYNSAEGIIIMKDSVKKAGFINKNFEYKVPRELINTVGATKATEYGQRVKEFYFGQSDICDKNLEQLCALESDFNFTYNVHRFADIYKRVTQMPLYMYVFSCDSELNILKRVSGYAQIEGACHADELFYLFESEMGKESVDEDKKLQQQVYMITKLWTNFAKHGNQIPDDTLSVQWSPYTTGAREYLSIGLELKMGQFANKDRVEFWNKLYSEAGLPSISKSNL